MKAVLIAGPTASGKSALALRIARRFGGVVINADSMQVYRDMRILTARPTPDEEATVPHRLYGHVPASENYSVGRWLADAAVAIDESRRAGLLPVVTGGTGLYFKALTEGLSDIPAIDPAVRSRVRSLAEGVSTVDLHAQLAAADPHTASRLVPQDRQRVLRALEVFEATGRPLAAFQNTKSAPIVPIETAVPVFLSVDRAVLGQRIDSRFAAMMAAGALEEARALAKQNLAPELPAMRAHGVPGLLAAIRGACSLNDAVAKGQADTRAYAKRQETWFRRQGRGFAWLQPEAAEDAISAALV